MRKNKYIFILLILVILSVDTACWDRTEVNKRTYVMGIGVDKYNAEKAEIEIKSEKNDPMYNFLFEMSALKEKGGEGGSFKIIVGSSNISQAIDVLETTIEYSAVLTHLQAIVLSEDVARNEMIQVTDFLLRNSDVRRRTKAFICQGKAADIFEYKPKISQTVGEYLNELPVNANNTPLVLVESDLGTISYSLATKIDFMLPKIYKQGKNITSKGGAVLNKYGKFIGWADNDIFEGARWIRNLYKRGSVSCLCPITKKTVIVNIKDSKTKIIINDDNSVLVSINVKGNIDTNLGGQTKLTQDYIRKINKDVEDAVKNKVSESAKFFQKKLKADVFFFKSKFKHFKHEIFKMYEDNWNEYFEKISIEVKVTADVENVGTITTMQ